MLSGVEFQFSVAGEGGVGGGGGANGYGFLLRPPYGVIEALMNEAFW